MGLFSLSYFLLGSLSISTAWNLIQADARQIPLHSDFNISTEEPTRISWDFFEEPNQDSTSQLIFNTANSFLQHWPNTRYRNGHTIVPGTIPIGTLLYHGSAKKGEIPRTPEWTAIDPEHSYFFCVGTPEDPGCWLLTLVATRPLRVLYFDGSSAAKFHAGGSMDSQDVLVWGEVRRKWLFEEDKRLGDLCKWGEQYGIDGYVRMEMDFEVMLCDFTAGVEVISSQHLTARERYRDDRPSEGKDMPVGAPGNASTPIKTATSFRLIEAGSWHNYFPGETRIRLNYAGILSFYDTALFPSLKRLRSKKERWDHRLQGISSEDVGTLLKTLGNILDGAWNRPTSGIDWKTLLRVVVDRYAGRLQVLNRLLNSTVLDFETDAILKKAHSHMSGMLSPYRIYSAPLPSEIHSMSTFSWAIPVFEECATIHTRYIDSNPFLSQKLTYSEHLLLNTTKSVSKEICRVIVRMWAEGMEYTISKEGFGCSAEELVTRWKGLTEELMDWLDWSEWVTCEPACGNEEICYLPTWPFFTGGVNWPIGWHPRRPNVIDDSVQSAPGWHPKPGEVSDSVKPAPKCLQRIDLSLISD